MMNSQENENKRHSSWKRENVDKFHQSEYNRKSQKSFKQSPQSLKVDKNNIYEYQSEIKDLNVSSIIKNKCCR